MLVGLLMRFCQNARCFLISIRPTTNIQVNYLADALTADELTGCHFFTKCSFWLMQGRQSGLKTRGVVGPGVSGSYKFNRRRKIAHPRSFVNYTHYSTSEKSPLLESVLISYPRTL